MNTRPRPCSPPMGGLEEDIPGVEGKILNQTLTSQIPLPMDSFFFFFGCIESMLLGAGFL